MLKDYADLLSEARIRAQLSGRPLTEAETAGIARGHASEAGNRLYRAKEVALKEEDLALRKKTVNEQLKAAERARKSERGQTAGMIIGGAAGAYFGAGNPYAIALGAGVGGEIGGSTWLCTETKSKAGLGKDTVQLLNKFRDYCIKNHKAWYAFYVRIGPEIVQEIEKAESDVAGFYETLKKKMVIPVTELTKQDRIEEAFELYKKYVNNFIVKYTPRYEMEAEVTEKVDNAFEEAA